MTAERILQSDILDILFENKNKQYGAYELRRTYNQRVKKSVGGMFLLVALASAGYLFGSNRNNNQLITVEPTDSLVLVDITEPPKEKIKKVEPPKAVAAPKRLATVKEDMIHYDLILTMDNDNYKEVRRMSGGLWNPEKVDMLLNYSYPGENRGVPDPWYGGEPDFHEVFEMISHACDRIIEKYAGELSM